MHVCKLTSPSASERTAQNGDMFLMFKTLLLFLRDSSVFIVSFMWYLVSIPSRIPPVEEASHWDSRVFYNHS